MSKVYNLEDLPAGQVTQSAPNGADDTSEPTTIDNLDALGVNAKTRRTIKLGYIQDFAQMFPSPSEARMAVMAALIEAGHPDDVLLGILLDERYAIGTRKGERISETEARKDIARARAKVKPKPGAAEEFATQPRKKLTFTPFVLPDKPPPPRDWIYPNIYIRQNVTLTTARGGTGKSTLIMTESVAMATGRALLGVDPLPGLRVAYWNGEDSPEELLRRLYAICKHYGIDQAAIKDRLFIDTGLTMPIKIAEVGENGAAKIALPLVSELQYALKFLKMDCLSVDPFISSHSISENDVVGMDAVVKTWSGMAQRGNVSIGLSHHTRKAMSSGTSVGAIEDSRGASSVIDAARVRRALNTMTESQAKGAGIDDKKRHYYVSADLSRSNLSPPASALTWYRLESVDLDNATDTHESDKVGVPEPYEYVNLGDVEFAIDEQRAALTALKAGIGLRMDIRADTWAGATIATALALDIDGKSKVGKSNRVRITKLIDDWLVKGVLEAYEETDGKRRPKLFIKCRT